MLFKKSLLNGKKLQSPRGLFFDESMSPMFEDADLCLRARELGLVVHIAGKIDCGLWVLVRVVDLCCLRVSEDML